MKEFKKLGISDNILRVIEEEKFEKPSEIQTKTIPLVLKGNDIIAGSATGSGKTLAFGSGIIQNTVSGKGIQALVLTPTRELAEQNMKALNKFSKHKPLRITAVYGGVSINPQMDSLRTADVVIGTPGRILDHINRKTIRLSDVKILVLDEADRMLDMGFIDDVERIIRECPRERQTLLFSATITNDVARLSGKYMKDAIKISAERQVDPSKLLQIYYDVDHDMKLSLLVHLLKNEESGNVMIFCNTRSNADFVANNLKMSGIEAMAIHGGFSQDKRNHVMERFHSTKLNIMVCTDVAARGLDIKDVTHVYNYDIPKDAKEYLHRVGRTARAGKEGKAVNILCSQDHDSFRRIIKDNELDVVRGEVPYIQRIPIKWKQERREGYDRPYRRGPRTYGSHSGSVRRGPREHTRGRF